MATVTPVPIVLGLIGAFGAFSVLVCGLVIESRPVAYGIPRPISHTRVAIIGMLFVVWSIWSTARPVSGWR